jgi:hypothetical protein
MHGTILLGLMTHLLGEVLNFLGITNKMASLLCNDVLSIVLQLKQMLGISSHVRPATVVVNLKDVAHLIHETFHSRLERSYIGYNKMGVPAVAANFCEHRAVSAMWAAFSIATSMLGPIGHVDHGLPSGNTGWDGISM